MNGKQLFYANDVNMLENLQTAREIGVYVHEKESLVRYCVKSVLCITIMYLTN